MREAVVELALPHEVEEGQLRVEVGDEDPRDRDARPVGELHRAREAALDLDARDRGVHANLAAVLLDEPDHGLGEDVRAADADRPAEGLERAGEHDRVVGAEAEDVARAGELGDPEAEPGLHLGRLEEVAGDVVRGGEEVAEEPEPLLRLLERAELLGGRHRRREHRRDDPLREHLAIDVRELPERLGVARRDARDARRRALDAPAADDRPPVGEDVGELVLRPDVAGPVALELEVPVDGAHMDDPVEVRVEVVPEAGRRHLLRGAAAARDAPRLEHEHPLPRLGEIAGARQPVVAAADDDDVVGALAHQSSSSQRCLASSQASAGDSSSGEM